MLETMQEWLEGYKTWVKFDIKQREIQRESPQDPTQTCSTSTQKGISRRRELQEKEAGKCKAFVNLINGGWNKNVLGGKFSNMQKAGGRLFETGDYPLFRSKK